MSKYFKIGAARCKSMGIPEGTVFPVKQIINNMVGGKGFDTSVILETGDGWYEGSYIGKDVEMFAVRGEFVTEDVYQLQAASKLEAVQQAAAEHAEQELLKLKRAFVCAFWQYNAEHALGGVLPVDAIQAEVDKASVATLDAEIKAAKQAMLDGDESIELMLTQHGLISGEE